MLCIVLLFALYVSSHVPFFSVDHDVGDYFREEKREKGLRPSSAGKDFAVHLPFSLTLPILSTARGFFIFYLSTKRRFFYQNNGCRTAHLAKRDVNLVFSTARESPLIPSTTARNAVNSFNSLVSLFVTVAVTRGRLDATQCKSVVVSREGMPDTSMHTQKKKREGGPV